jgi:hypothetical protein
MKDILTPLARSPPARGAQGSSGSLEVFEFHGSGTCCGGLFVAQGSALTGHESFNSFESVFAGNTGTAFDVGGGTFCSHPSIDELEVAAGDFVRASAANVKGNAEAVLFIGGGGSQGSGFDADHISLPCYYYL